MSLNEAAQLSQRIGRIIQYLQSGEATYQFIQRTGKAKSFDELSSADQELIERLEAVNSGGE